MFSLHVRMLNKAFHNSRPYLTLYQVLGHGWPRPSTAVYGSSPNAPYPSSAAVWLILPRSQLDRHRICPNYEGTGYGGCPTSTASEQRQQQCTSCPVFLMTRGSSLCIVTSCQRDLRSTIILPLLLLQYCCCYYCCYCHYY